VEASVFALAACALLVLLGLVSMMASWELAGVSGWIWFVLAVPEMLLVGALALDAPRNRGRDDDPGDRPGKSRGLGLLIASLVPRRAASSPAAAL
jgi:hypothetical protein